MEIRNTTEDLKALLGVAPPSSSMAQQIRGGSAAGQGALTGDRATLSGAGTEVSLSAADETVRMDRVAEVQAALAAGTYQIPAKAVATKLVDAMLSVPSDR